MKFSLLLLSCLASAGAAELSSVRSVYLLSMGNGLDQYIANRLTTEHVIQVVTDPKRADAVLTDRLGPGFEARLGELYPPPPPPEVAKDKAKDKDKDKDKSKDQDNQSGALGDTVNKLDKPGLMSASFGRGRGTIFLVDVKSRQVVWSTFEKPKDSTAKELDRTAARIVSDIKKRAAPAK